MLLLAVDTATPAVTVALHDGNPVLAESSQVDARRHGELLLPAVDRVLAEAGLKLDDVTGIVVGVGPGPYTGLRVGLVTAATFGAALGVPVHGLCTLDGLAYAAGLDGPFVVATDARRKEVYWARYGDPRTRGQATPPWTAPPTSPSRSAGLPAVGAGALLYPDGLPGRARRPSTSRPPRWPRWPRGGWPPGEELPAAPAALPAPARRPGARELQGGHRPSDARQSTRPGPRRRPARDALVGHRARAGPGARAVPRGRLVARACSGPSWPTPRPRATRRYVVAEDGGPPGRLRGARRRGGPATSRPSPSPATSWGTGLGARLLTELLRAATAFECDEVLLEVRVDNARAQRLYERFGFEPIGFRRGYYQPGNVDALVMRDCTDSAPKPERVQGTETMADEPLVLGIETSCDETGVGIVRGHTLLADAIASSVDEHARFGGVVPEVASPRAPGGDGPDHRARPEGRRGQRPRPRRHRGHRRARAWPARCWSASRRPRRTPTRSASRCTASTTWPRTSASTSWSTARCRSRRWRCWCPAGTPRCCWPRTSPPTYGRWARPSTTRRARRSTRSPGCCDLGFPGGPVIDRLAPRGRPDGDPLPARADRAARPRPTTSPSPA